MRDALSAERRRLPMVRIEKDYRFQTRSGEKRLIDLFEGRPQLGWIVRQLRGDLAQDVRGFEPADQRGGLGRHHTDEHVHGHLSSGRSTFALRLPFKRPLGFQLGGAEHPPDRPGRGRAGARQVVPTGWRYFSSVSGASAFGASGLGALPFETRLLLRSANISSRGATIGRSVVS